jgi:hypothetical protein
MIKISGEQPFLQEDKFKNLKILREPQAMW